MRTLLLCVALLQASLYQQASSLSSGAPPQACDTLSPNPTQHGAQPQTSTVPYSIDLDQFCYNGTYSYTPGATYTGCKLLRFDNASICILDNINIDHGVGGVVYYTLLSEGFPVHVYRYSTRNCLIKVSSAQYHYLS